MDANNGASRVDIQEDPLWRLALDDRRTEDDSLTDDRAGPMNQFRVSSDRCEPTMLQLSPLPIIESFDSPVGANAWYCSALLTTML
jgi:hypothetical protein